jgi:cell division transport system permease protein
VATVIRHALVEGLILVRQRAIVSTILGLALSIPLTVAGLTACLVVWIGPVRIAADAPVVVPVLLRPELDDTTRGKWLDDQRDLHADWRIHLLTREEVGRRLSDWFPSLAGLLREDDGNLVPPLIEIATRAPDDLKSLENDPAVLAVGPRDPILGRLARSGRRLSTVMAAVCAILLAGAGLLAGVWVHLELYRHGDELTIMRLVGATEGAIRGPFLVAVAAPGLLAAILSPIATWTTVATVIPVVTGLGFPALVLPRWVLAAEGTLGLGLPLAAAWIVVARHARIDIEGT